MAKRLSSNLLIERSVFSPVNPEFSTYLNIQLSPSTLCSSKNDNTQHVFVYVLSSIKSFERRQLIRKTWANNNNLRVAFIIGKSTELIYEQLIQIEQNNYDDIIQGNFIDSYRTLSYKSLTAWKWFNDNCDPKQIKFIIKIDDDVILNSYYLNDILSDKQNEYNIQNLKSTFSCTVFTGYSPDKDPASKYYVNDNEYNANLYGISYYSDYCFGPGFLMNVDLAAKLYSQSLGIKLFWLDDAYVGILARYTNAKLKHYDTELYWDNNNSDTLNKNLSKILFIRNIETNSDFNKIWNSLIRY